MIMHTGKGLLLVLLALLAVGTALFAAETPAPPVDTAVRWASADGSVEVVLAQVANKKTHTNYRLIVISAKTLQVTYHTEINSSQKVVRVLKPVASSLRDVKVYEFGHEFSRTTIWMALTFSRGGKPVAELTRSFYDGIEHPVSNSSFKL